MECLRRLASQPVGRFAVADPGEPPLVVPVNFLLDGDTIVFRTELGRKVLLVHRVTGASFEVDDIDPIHRTGWSVLVQGHAHEASLATVRHLPLQPWVGGPRNRWIRLVPERITGRTIRLPDPDRDPRGYL